MTLQALTQFFLPMGLSVIMLGLGLSLTIEDFKRVWLFPKAIFVGLFCQLTILPLFAFALCFILKLQPEFAIGLIVLAASPGGVTSNIFSHFSGGDVALNMTLTALNSFLAAITLPLYTLLALFAFAGKNLPVNFQYAKLTEFFFIILIPTSIGMCFKILKPHLAKKYDTFVRWFAALFMIGINVAAIYSQGRYFLGYLPNAGFAVLFFNMLSLGIGYWVPRMFQIEKRMAIATTFEIGIHNGAMALVVAMSALGGGAYAVPAALYSILMYITASLVTWRFRTSSIISNFTLSNRN